MKIPKLFKRVELVDVSDPFDLGDIGHAIMDDGRVQIIGKDRAMAMLEGNNRSGRNTANTRVAKMADRARSEGVKPRAQAGGAPGDPPRRRRSDAGKPRPKSRTRPLEASPANVHALFRAGLGYRQIGERLGISPGLAHSLKGEHDRAGMTMFQRVQQGLRTGGEQVWLSGYDVLKAHARASLTTANNNGGGLVGNYRMPGAGFDLDMGSLQLMDALNVVPIARGELLVYSGDQAPVPIWTAEGAALVDNTTPTVGRVEAGPKTVSSVYEFSSALAQAGGPEAEAEFMGWVDQILYEEWIGAALVGDGTMDRPRGILRNPAVHTIDYGAAVTEAHIRAVRDRLRTQKGTGEDPLWILSEAWASAAITGGWASETTPHGGVMLPDNGGNGIPYLIVQGLTSVAKIIDYTLLAADVNGGALVDLAGKMQGQGFSTMPIPVVSGGSGAGATIDAITVNGFGSITSVTWDNNGANYVAGDTITLTQNVDDPAILGYASEFILPTWGMVVTRFPDPATLQVKFKLENICSAVQSKGSSFVISHT